MSISCAIDLRSSPTAGERPIVYIVDDDVSVRESLSLQMENEGWHAECFVTAQEYLARPPAIAPSCLVLDIVLPGINGLDLQRLVADEWAVTPVIIITGYGDVPKTVQAMKAGAVEFLTKPLREETLLPAVRQALTRSQAALVHKVEWDRLRRCYASLTQRERQVMWLVVLGRPNKLVADELHISEITVKAHRGRVMQKMQANSLPELVRMAARLQRGPGSRAARDKSDSAATADKDNAA